MQLNREQEAAVEMADRAARAGAGVFRLSGPAGTGKTTVLKQIMADNTGAILLTPTGRAAMRARDLTGYAADTIHHWLYHPSSDGKTGVTFRQKPMEEISDAPLLVVDEASMVSRSIWADLSRTAATKGIPVLLVGDGFQLPPVDMSAGEPFSVFADDFPVDHSVTLTEVFRQALGSPVMRAATGIRGCDSFGEAVAIARAELNIITDPVAESARLYADDRDHVIICHKNDTRIALNIKMRHALLGLNPRDDVAPNEPLLVRRNVRDLGIYNGEVIPAPVFDSTKTIDDYGSTSALFHCASLPLGRIAMHQPTIRTGRDKEIPNRMADELKSRGLHLVLANLGYVLSCHAAQGSEWEDVVLVLEDSLRVMPIQERIRWLYTAVSRAMTSVSISC